MSRTNAKVAERQPAVQSQTTLMPRKREKRLITQWRGRRASLSLEFKIKIGERGGKDETGESGKSGNGNSDRPRHFGPRNTRNDAKIPSLKLRTFASVSPKARTEDEHRVDSSQQRCCLRLSPFASRLSPMTHHLSPFASVSPRARTEDEHRVDSNQQRCRPLTSS